MKKLIIGVGIAFAAGIAYLLFLYFVRPTNADLGLAIHPSNAHTNGQVNVRWFGVSTLLIEDGKTNLMIDGFFSRPSLLDLVTDRPIGPDEQAIQNTLTALNIRNLDAVMTVHSHYDHAMDAGVVAKLTNARVLGSSSTANIAKGAGIPESQLETVSLEQEYRFGDFLVQFYPSNHAPLADGGPPMPGTIESPLTPPQPISAWREGGSYSIVIKHPETSMLIQGSAGFEPSALQNVRVDNVFLGIGGLSGFERSYAKQYVHETVTQTQASKVFVIHHDDFITAPFGEIRLLPTLVMDKIFLFELQQWVLPAELYALNFNQPITLGTQAAKSTQVQPIWIDVRSSFEHAVDSIDGDIHIPHEEILTQVSQRYPDRNTPIKLYCGSGGRSGEAMSRLSEAGYLNVSNEGGIDDARQTRGIN